MRLERLYISGFKNIESQLIEPAVSLSGFWGQNGMGKTNLLEALYVLAKGKSFRPYSHREDWNPVDGQSLRVEALFKDSLGLEYELSLHRNAADRLQWTLNGKKEVVGRIAEKIPLVVFSPDDHSLIRGAPEQRRSYFDDLLTDVCPGYSEVLGRFEKTLKSRNRLLKGYQKQEIFEFTKEMETWTHALAQEARSLNELRSELWPKFSKYFQELATGLFEGLVEDLSIHYEEDTPVLEENQYFQVLRDKYSVDIATGWTHRGPHRDDFRIELGNIDARAKASQGQARLLALSLRWCHALWVAQERQEIPVFLIDDFSNELDILRRKKLLELLGQISGQILVTGTDSELINSAMPSADLSDLTSFEVAHGKINKVAD